MASLCNGDDEMSDMHDNAGNFANDPERAALAGKKGGKLSGGRFKKGDSRAAEAGRKGGSAKKAANE
jgi:general stress protein YciG